jgi:hypothetical protein
VTDLQYSPPRGYTSLGMAAQRRVRYDARQAFRAARRKDPSIEIPEWCRKLNNGGNARLPSPRALRRRPVIVDANVTSDASMDVVPYVVPDATPNVPVNVATDVGPTSAPTLPPTHLDGHWNVWETSSWLPNLVQRPASVTTLHRHAGTVNCPQPPLPVPPAPDDRDTASHALGALLWVAVGAAAATYNVTLLATPLGAFAQSGAAYWPAAVIISLEVLCGVFFADAIGWTHGVRAIGKLGRLSRTCIALAALMSGVGLVGLEIACGIERDLLRMIDLATRAALIGDSTPDGVAPVAFPVIAPWVPLLVQVGLASILPVMTFLTGLPLDTLLGVILRRHGKAAPARRAVQPLPLVAATALAAEIIIDLQVGAPVRAFTIPEPRRSPWRIFWGRLAFWPTRRHARVQAELRASGERAAA